jgi:chitinase
MNFKKYILSLITALALPLQAQAALTLYTTNWSMYGNYEYDGAYKRGAPDLKVKNPNMVEQFNKADVVAWSFMQVWNNKKQKGLNIPDSWNGLMHFSDMWAELPSEAPWKQHPEAEEFMNFCKANSGSCANIAGGKLLQYEKRQGAGQFNSFGAFINSKQYTAKRIIAIGGANTLENKSVSTDSFDAIFQNQDKFLNQFKSWMTHFKNLQGIDYDFEPPVDASGGQLVPDGRTLEDYKKLYNLIKKTREVLGKEAYISVTLTVDRNYLDAINRSIDAGWFKETGSLVNSINLMTYDMHGPWNQNADPYTAIHTYIQQPEGPKRDSFAINYGIDEIIEQLLRYKVQPEKLQVGLASYGRGFAGVEAGENIHKPGFEQNWTGPSKFSEDYSKQDGMLPYSSIVKAIDNLGYKTWHIQTKDENNESFISGSYIYNSDSKQFIGYQSPEVVRNICKFVQKKHLQGVILWSADTDLPVSNPLSLLRNYKEACLD